MQQQSTALKGNVLFLLTTNNTVAMIIGDHLAAALVEFTMKDFICLRDKLRYNEMGKSPETAIDVRGNTFSLHRINHVKKERRMMLWNFAYGKEGDEKFHVFIKQEDMIDHMNIVSPPWALLSSIGL